MYEANLMRRLAGLLYINPKIMGDLKEKDTTSIFDEKLTKAICVFQHRHGLQCDSVLGAKTIDALRVSVHERINQMLINIERSRWLPKDFHGDYLMVNIPDFKLLLYLIFDQFFGKIIKSDK